MTELLDGIGNKEPLNHLYYGDNLTIMRNMASNSVDLIYLDPPFNSQRSYNLIYKQLTGLPVPEQEEAFCDAWELDAEKEEMARNMPFFLREQEVDEQLVLFWDAWINALRNTQPKLLAYLVYMSYRLFEMKRILRPTGSIYLHCDPTASHYIKVILDGIFGHNNFKNEIIWKRTSARSDSHKYNKIHDIILFYSKTSRFIWNTQFTPYDDEYLSKFYRHVDVETGRRFTLSDLMASGTRNGSSGKPWKGIDPGLRGNHWKYTIEKLEEMNRLGQIHWPSKGSVPRQKRYLDEMSGVPLQSIWTDIPPIGAHAKERLGYPTQKPIGLLERIIRSSSNSGDIIFDPFCGCGTSIYAAHLNDRRWIGCDIAILSIRLVRDILLKRYGLEENVHYKVSGVPLSVDGAQELFKRDPHQFQHWAVELAGGFCSKKRSGDQGIDGRLYFQTSSGLESMVISVKGGNATPAYVRELRGVLERDSNAKLAGFICLNDVTKGMKQESASAGMYSYMGVDYPRLQIRTIADLLDKRYFETPSRVQTMNKEKQSVFPF